MPSPDPLSANMLDAALTLAVLVHTDQSDSFGEPYVDHVARVVSRLLEDGHDEVTLTVAALHDVTDCGDKDVSELLEDGFPHEVVELVDVVTLHPGETYMDLIYRAAGNPITRAVMAADVEDNLGNLSDRPGSEPLRKQYEEALSRLLACAS